MNDKLLRPLSIPGWMIWVQCICFAVLYAIWAVPETILIRHICLILGALIGVYEITFFRDLFFRKAAISTWLIITLFCWITLHLLFLSHNFDLQYFEYVTIWKRIVIGFIFALGFGLALSSIPQNTMTYAWKIFYLGLLLPSLIYILKYFLTLNEQNLPFEVPSYLKIYRSSSLYFIHKVAYVCFCFPVLAVAIGRLGLNFSRNIFISKVNFIYLHTILVVMFVVYTMNIKNVVVFTTVLLVFFSFRIFRGNFKKYWIAKALLILSIILSANLFWSDHIKKNESWLTIVSDAKVAIDVERFEHWKYNGSKGYPNNEMGKKVSPTNYERIAWAKVGTTLLLQHPLGYGMVEKSFGYLSKEVWPDALLHQSHSGWLDLALGIGIPGICLILFALIFNMYSLDRLSAQKPVVNQDYYFGVIFFWILAANFIMWFTTEISQKVFLDSLIFMISLAGGFLIGSQKQTTS